MDLTPYFSGIISAAVFVLGAFFAMRNANERRFATLEAHQASQDERIAQALEESKISRELTVRMAELSTKLDGLSDDVRKHNELIERTYVIERDLKTAFHRIDEVREDVHDIKVGGTK